MDIIKAIHFTSKVWILALPSLMMAMDIVTGLTFAWVSKTFDSAKMRSGLGKKFAEIAYIVIGIAVTLAMGVPQYISMGIAVYIIFMEIMSIMENCDKLGAPVPHFVKSVINNINDSLQNDDYTELMAKLSKYDAAKLAKIIKLMEQSE